MLETVRVGIPYYKNVLPWTYTTNWNTLSVLNLFAEPLVRSFDGKLWPGLAQSWQVYDKGRRWVFSLRPKATFHDGLPCTMMDVMACIEIAKDQVDELGIPSPLPHYLQNLEFNLIDRQTIEVVSDEPNGDIADFLSEILICKKNRSNEFVIGTGNYKFFDYVSKRSLRLRKIGDTKRFSAYKEIMFKIIPDAEERFDALRRGKVDYITDLQNLPYRPEEEDFHWFRTNGSLSIFCHLNGTKKPFCFPEARRAINMAIDVEGLIQQVFHGNGIPAATVVSPYHCGFESSIKPIPYNPGEAKRLFGLIDMPEELIIKAPLDIPKGADKIAEYISEQLALIGINSRIEIQSNRQQYAYEIMRKEIGDIAIASSSMHSTFRILADKISSEEKGNWWQGIVDFEVDKLINAANRESDITTRERKYAAALQHLNKNPQWLYLFHPILVSASRPEVEGIQLLHRGVLRFPGSW